MFTTAQYSTSTCERGIPLTFGLIRPLKEKIVDLVSIQVTNFVATIRTRNNHNIQVNDVVDIVSGGNISPAFIGQKTIVTITPDSFSFIINVPDIISTAITAYAYTVPNIASSDRYIVNFTKELVVPDDATVDIIPSAYEINGANNFEPQTMVRVISNFTTSSKTIVKLSITDLYNKILYTEYKQISCSRLSENACEIKSKTVINTEFIYLNRENDWTYQYNGFLIAQFIPYYSEFEDDYPDISIRLIKQDPADLPISINVSLGVGSDLNDRLLLTINPTLLIEKNINREEIKETILENPTSRYFGRVVSIDDDTDEWIIQSSALNISALENLIIKTVENESILIKDIGAVSLPRMPSHPVPATSLLKTIKVAQYREDRIFGQLIYDPNVYLNSDIILYSDDYPDLRFTLDDYSLYGQEV